MKAPMLLCDYAVVAEGKLFISGAGWSLTGPGPSPHAIAVLVAVPWDQANIRMTMHLDLQDADGQLVTQTGPTGAEEPIQIGAEFEVGRPAELAKGTPIDMPLAINLPGLALAPGLRYQWVLTVNDATHDDWTLPFSVRPLGQAAPGL